MKNRKTILIAALVGCLLFSAGCGGKEPQPQSTAPDPTAAAVSNPAASESKTAEDKSAEDQSAKAGTVESGTAEAGPSGTETVQEETAQGGSIRPSAETGTTAAKGNETTVSQPETIRLEEPETHERSARELKASFDSLADGSAALEAYRSNEIAFSNEAKLYGMNSETAALVTYKEGSFRCCVMKLQLKNTKKYDLTVHSVLSPDNGKNGVWVCGVSQYGTFDVASNSTALMPVTVLYDSSVTPENAVEQALRGMKLTLEYSDLTDSGAEKNGEVGAVNVKM